MIKKVIMYENETGTLFKTKKEALKYEKKYKQELALREFADSLFKDTEIGERLVDNINELRIIFKKDI